MVKPKKAPATECCTLSVALDITVVTGRKSGSAPRSLEASRSASRNDKPSQTQLDAQRTAPTRAGSLCTIPHSQKYQFQHPRSSLGETVIFSFSWKEYNLIVFGSCAGQIFCPKPRSKCEHDTHQDDHWLTRQ